MNDSVHCLDKMHSLKGSKECYESAQSFPPGDIKVDPVCWLVFKSGFLDSHTYNINLINTSTRRIGFAIKTTNTKALNICPTCGILDPEKSVQLTIRCVEFAYGKDEDRVTVEWTNTPDGASKQFKSDWFLEGIFRRHKLHVLYMD